MKVGLLPLVAVGALLAACGKGDVGGSDGLVDQRPISYGDPAVSDAERPPAGAERPPSAPQRPSPNPFALGDAPSPGSDTNQPVSPGGVSGGSCDLSVDGCQGCSDYDACVDCAGDAAEAICGLSEICDVDVDLCMTCSDYDACMDCAGEDESAGMICDALF